MELIFRTNQKELLYGKNGKTHRKAFVKAHRFYLA